MSIKAHFSLNNDNRIALFFLHAIQSESICLRLAAIQPTNTHTHRYDTANVFAIRTCRKQQTEKQNDKLTFDLFSIDFSVLYLISTHYLLCIWQVRV